VTARALPPEARRAIVVEALADAIVAEVRRLQEARARAGSPMEGGLAAAAQGLRDGTLPAPNPAMAAAGRKSGATRAKKAAALDQRPAKPARGRVKIDRIEVEVETGAARKKAPRVVDTGEKIPRGAPVDGLALVRRMAGVIARLGGIDAAEALADELAAMGGAS